jgi:nucleoside-diphosphate-sugar epimerase
VIIRDGTVIEQVLTATGKVLEISYSENRKLDLPVSILDITAAKKAFSWTPRTTFVSGVMQHWNWLRTV